MKKLKIIKDKFKEWQPSTYVTVLLLIIPFLLFAAKKFVLDNDFWFLANTGKYILKNGFITVEPFTIHSGLYFIPQQWLSTVIFYFIYNNFGVVGILLLELVVNCLIICLIYNIAKLISGNKKNSIIITILVDLLIIFTATLTSRPQIFDVLLLLLVLYLLENYIKKDNTKYLLPLPLISVLLINLHASIWLILFVFLIPYYIEYGIKKLKKEKIFKIKPLLVVTIISFLCGLINPYHINSILYLFKSYGIKEINTVVGEMKSPTISTHIIVFAVIFINMIFIYKNKGNNKIRYVLLFLGTTYLTLCHLRGMMFLLIISVLILSSIKCKSKKYKKYSITNLEKAIYIVLIMALSIFIAVNIRIKRSSPLVDLANYLDKNASHDIVVFTEYDYGNYLEYRGYKCYLDTRAEVFLKSNNKKEDIFIEYYNLNSGKLNASKFLKKYDFDYLAVFPNNYYLLNELKKNANYEKIKYTNKKKAPILYKKKTN